MEREEKIFALQLLLESMRGYFPSSFNDIRMIKAKQLAIELGFKVHADWIDKIEEESGWDGRHFRTSMENGGYKGMEALHGLKDTFHDKSLEFRLLMKQTLEFPEYAFSDWEQPPANI